MIGPARAARVAAQAKINLRLKVLGMQDTGYHTLETVFLRLDLCDLVTVRTGKGRSLEVTGADALIRAAGPTENNLALRAADAYAARAGWPDGFSITLEKRIPVGAGLGGGSADAAAVLRTLDFLAPAPLPPAELHALAASLGSDVPFLASDHVMALGHGRGERLSRLPVLPSRPVVLAVPPFGMPTKDAYGWLGMSVGDHDRNAAALPDDAFSSWESAATYAENDFEAEVGRHHPLCARIKSSLLERGALVAMLSGSGSSVFGIFAESVPASGSENAEWKEILTRTAAHVVPVERMD